VENRPGAGTNIGAEFVARADADGYVFLLGDSATYAANKSLYEKLRYDAEKDFAPISLGGRLAIVLLVNTDKLPVGSVTELIAAAKKQPGKIDYASGGIGNPFHLASEMFGQAAGIKLNHVPYRGAGPALQDLVAGQVGMMFVDFATARGQLNNRQIRAIAVASPTEFHGLPACRRWPRMWPDTKSGHGRALSRRRRLRPRSSASCATPISRPSTTRM